MGEEAGSVATGATTVGVETVAGVGLAFGFFRGVAFGRKRPRLVGGSLKTTILLGLLVLSGRAGGEIVVEDEVDMMVYR